MTPTNQPDENGETDEQASINVKGELGSYKVDKVATKSKVVSRTLKHTSEMTGTFGQNA